MKTVLRKALKILILPLLFLLLYPIQKELAGEWEDKFGSEMIYLPYWKHWMEDEATAYALTKAARQFEETKGRWPKDLRELQQAKLIAEVPPNPAGGQYRIEPKHERVRIAYFKETDIKCRREEIAFELLSAADKFEQTHGRLPADLDELVEKKIIGQVPKDPGDYEFCYDPFRKQVGIQYGKFVREMQFGWNNVLSDLLWIRGFHYVQGQWQLIEAEHEKPKEGWHKQLPDLYDVVTDLDPHFVPAYRGGALLVGALSHRPRRAIKLLKKGIDCNPTKYWELPYQLASAILLDVGDEKRALKWLQRASNKEYYSETGDMALRLRSYLEAKHNRFDVAIHIWEPWLESDSPVYRQVAEDQISRILTTVIAKRLLEGIRMFKKAKKRRMADDEFAAFVKLVKKNVAKEYAEDKLKPALDIAMDADFRLWLFVRLRPPAGEPLKTTAALGSKRNAVLVKLQQMVGDYKENRGDWPDSFDDLIREKLIDSVPSPVGGGEFYLELCPRRTASREPTGENGDESEREHD